MGQKKPLSNVCLIIVGLAFKKLTCATCVLPQDEATAPRSCVNGRGRGPEAPPPIYLRMRANAWWAYWSWGNSPSPVHRRSRHLSSKAQLAEKRRWVGGTTKNRFASAGRGWTTPGRKSARQLTLRMRPAMAGWAGTSVPAPIAVLIIN